MIFIPDGDNTLRILSIDPGSDTLGASIIDIDLNTHTATIIDSRTYNAALQLKHGPQYLDIADTHGNRRARLVIHKNNLVAHMNYWKPHMVICESPFMGLSVSSYMALVEVVDIIREAVHQYDVYVCLYTVKPMEARKAVGVSGKGKTKDDTRNAVIEMVNNRQTNLSCMPQVPLLALDEHSIDSIAVGYYLYLELLKTL